MPRTVDIPHSSNDVVTRRQFIEFAGAAGVALGNPRLWIEAFRLALSAEDRFPNPLYLSTEHRQRLALAAEKFITSTPAEADIAARGMDFIPGTDYELAENSCGPLAMRIAVDSGFIDTTTLPVNIPKFWTPAPAGLDRGLFQQTFPSSLFSEYSTSTPINLFDFTRHPLQAGDILYLRAGRGGNFDHMLIVTRNEDQKAYCVTNVVVAPPNIANIQEVPLYDLDRPGIGQFFEWANPRNRQLGLTGWGGFIHYRRKVAPDVERVAGIRRVIDRILDASGGHWLAYIKRIGGEEYYSRNLQEQRHPASVIKVAIAVSLIKALGLAWKNGRHFEEPLWQWGVRGQSFGNLLSQMLVYSDESATEMVLEALTHMYRVDLTKIVSLLGMRNTTLEPRASTALDTAVLLERLYAGGMLGSTARNKILGLMAQHANREHAADKRLGAISQAYPGTRVYSKRGFLTEPQLVIADAGIVEAPSGAYLLVLYGYQKKGATDSTLETAITNTAKAFAKFIFS